MNTQRLARTDEFTEMGCGECGIVFWVPEPWRAEKKSTGKGWSCPNGHSRVYRDSDAVIAQKALAAEQERHRATLARLNEAQTAARKTEAATKRLKKRVADGVCPCCHRTFKQLAAHMKNKHPEGIT